MLLEIEHHSGVPIYRQIIDQIRQQIISDQVHEGEQLPSVRDTAKALKINPMTVSKVYSLLEIEGLIEKRRGIGIFAAKVKKSEKKHVKRDMLEKILKKAAVRAVQFDISEDELRELLSKQYKDYNIKCRRQKWKIETR